MRLRGCPGFSRGPWGQGAPSKDAAALVAIVDKTAAARMGGEVTSGEDLRIKEADAWRLMTRHGGARREGHATAHRRETEDVGDFAAGRVGRGGGKRRGELWAVRQIMEVRRPAQRRGLQLDVKVLYEGDHGARQTEWTRIVELNRVAKDAARCMEAEKYGETVAQKRRRMGGAQGARWRRYVRLTKTVEGEVVSAEPAPVEVDEGKRQRRSPRVAGVAPEPAGEFGCRRKRAGTGDGEPSGREAPGGTWAAALAATDGAAAGRGEDADKRGASAGGAGVDGGGAETRGRRRAREEAEQGQRRKVAKAAGASESHTRRCSPRSQAQPGQGGKAVAGGDRVAAQKRRRSDRLAGWSVEDAPV